MNLGATTYNLVQKIVTGDSSRTYGLLKKNMGFKPGDQVVDIGCGTGLISKNFTKDKVRYLGCDIAEDRIEYAKKFNPQAEFFCAYAQDVPQADFSFSMVHGVLHHMADEDIRNLMRFLKKKGCRVFGGMELERPSDPRSNILGTFFCDYLDDGEYIRTFSEYKKLLEEFGQANFERFRWPLIPAHNLIFTLKFNE